MECQRPGDAGYGVEVLLLDVAVAGEEVFDLVPAQRTYRAPVQVRVPLRTIRVPDVIPQIWPALGVELHR